jgi:hypothetical protein
MIMKFQGDWTLNGVLGCCISVASLTYTNASSPLIYVMMGVWFSWYIHFVYTFFSVHILKEVRSAAGCIV